VFTYHDGGPLHPDSIRQRFDRLAAAVGSNTGTSVSTPMRWPRLPVPSICLSWRGRPLAADGQQGTCTGPAPAAALATRRRRKPKPRPSRPPKDRNLISDVALRQLRSDRPLRGAAGMFQTRPMDVHTLRLRPRSNADDLNVDQIVPAPKAAKTTSRPSACVPQAEDPGRSRPRPAAPQPQTAAAFPGSEALSLRMAFRRKQAQEPVSLPDSPSPDMTSRATAPHHQGDPNFTASPNITPLALRSRNDNALSSVSN